jgi:ERCC4-type nuclease
LTTPRNIHRPKGKMKIQLHILQELPNIGPSRAKKLLEKFHSIEAVMNANITDLQSVNGIVHEIAKRICEAIRLTFDEKNNETLLCGGCPRCHIRDWRS